MSATEYDYDLIVIGAGPVGENIADYAVRAGNDLRVAIVESELVGGECSYWACMPSKALLRSGHALRAARRLAGSKEPITGGLDVAAVLARRTEFTSGWKDDGQVAWLDSVGIELIRGRGRLAGPRAVSVGDRVYTAAAVAIATGSVPVLPPIPGLAEAAPWGTREATESQLVPTRLVVVGGGVAGTELAFAFASLGSRVTLLSRDGLLDREEPFVSELLAAAAADEGIDVRIGVGFERVDRDADGTVRIQLSTGAEVSADEILVSTGRRPNTGDLGLDVVGLDARTAIAVDETMLVAGTDWLYAVGDVNGRALLTHQGKYQARAAGEAIAARLAGEPVDDAPWGAHVATADHAAVPHVVFTDPEVASVGLTEAQARERGLDVRAVEYDLGWVAGAKLHADGYTGRAKLVVDESRGVVIGATFVGQDVAELLHSATVAIVGEVPIDRLWHAVPSYPTISEIWLRLLEAYGRPQRVTAAD
ncbi:NAD(P)/FAD-dependent oxidoreductase [Schumannella sp. 10F1B-5-1]|uniref:dihydrolipoyl dehydrogenase family protein n=1 Tax=Schumannella sp. 10F1B-5-1 TaxID=2590780 RepID=UPI0011314FC4|nr:NAD(P)/FAD-dependent oxidoreductase [Schumannella sp. 10F1B-5-1]TPW78358.1 NAD(P)/FAD-dependent oxidoreductase [Schumannella sp. 10F1B-5-1]